jgi:hypothetical protein
MNSTMQTLRIQSIRVLTPSKSLIHGFLSTLNIRPSHPNRPRRPLHACFLWKSPIVERDNLERFYHLSLKRHLACSHLHLKQQVQSLLLHLHPREAAKDPMRSIFMFRHPLLNHLTLSLRISRHELQTGMVSIQRLSDP